MQGKTYVETFEHGPGGWWGWISNARGPKALEYRRGMVISRSPWSIDYNHAPPGAGYLHMLFCMFTRGPIAEHYREVGGENALIRGEFGTDFTDAKFTVRLKGELESRGAELLLLIQATVNRVTSAWVLTGRPFEVTTDWSEQTVPCRPDPKQWTCLEGRHDRRDYYGHVDLHTVMRDVNCDMMLVLFPLSVVPMGEMDGDMHVLRPEKDYPVWCSRLPEGYVMLDTVRIEFAAHSQAAVASTEGPDCHAAIGDQQGHSPKEADR